MGDREIAKRREERIKYLEKSLRQVAGWWYLPEMGDDPEKILKAIQWHAREALKGNIEYVGEY